MLSTLGMDQIVDINRAEGVAVVGPGVNLAALHAAVEAEGWFYPPDPNSASMCSLGGNIAENAGGPRAFKYGVTRDYVLGLEAMLIGGQKFFAGRRTKKGVTGYDVDGALGRQRRHARRVRRHHAASHAEAPRRHDAARAVR